MVRVHGIYKICMGDRVFYVGQSVNMRARIARHKRELRNGTHRNAHLQNVANKYGVDALSFCVVEESDRALTPLEMRYIRELRPECNKDMPSKDDTWSRSDEYRKALSERMRGRKLPDSAYENSRKYWSGRHLSDEAKRKISEKNSGRTRVMREDEKRMRSEAMKRYYQMNADEEKVMLTNLMAGNDCFFVMLGESATEKRANALRMRCRRAALGMGKKAKVKATDNPQMFVVMMNE